ncbi:AraC family transcriptional regulator [Vallitalea longa]|uniref:AraC family transcriptional regulator n=1 Tax=Vallitalea longa TaxID=2936439 RepID=A0A9W5YC66_9FIRM|nr:AraC family transcriptional regulator [Vallitalea longa]GKX29648.1 AraC family transcriptional regulator [Vallitalea longa]
MDWIDRLNEAIDYIEKNLDNEISNDVLGKIALCPMGTLQRTFSLMTGITISEYIRRRKLTMAAFDLQSTDCKVIDIAMKYGYTSSDAFCVAFKRMHGTSPINAKHQNIRLKSYPRLSFTLKIEGEIEMDYHIVEKESFKVVGKIVTSTSEENKVPAFWNQCKEDGTVDKLINISVDSTTIGMCFGYNDEGLNDYMVGVETNHEPIEGTKTIEVTKSTWLVFESIGPIQPNLGNTWGRIYGEFLPQSTYKQACLPTIEKYFGGNVNADDYRVEIWIPIITK